MSAYSTAPAFAASRGVRTPSLWAMLTAMLRARQTRRLLAEMDDRLLADIGVSRGDAATEASRPFWDLG